MDNEEIDKRLANGELLFCPECDLFHNDNNQAVCEIIICTNPFTGPSDLDIEDRITQTVNNFNSFYKKEIKKI
ncbi:MAG: hypothetical protein ACFFG0_51065 [Candidatus Thorarchaeota archaeon]